MALDTTREFHDDAIPLVSAKVIAGRSWRVYSDGILTGVTYGHEWKERGNAAVCPYIGATIHKGGQVRFTNEDTDARVPDGWRNAAGTNLWPHGKYLTRKHNPGALGCACGWWGYGDVNLSGQWGFVYRFRPTVTGLVQFYGHMTRGTKGFRAQYADMRALVEPGWASDHEQKPGEPCSPAEMWDRVAANYPNTPVYPDLGVAQAEQGYLS